MVEKNVDGCEHIANQAHILIIIYRMESKGMIVWKSIPLLSGI